MDITYRQYVEAQSLVNKEKFDFTNVADTELDWIARYVKENVPDAKLGICHGIRNGYECKELERRTSCKVIGTDISDTANKVEGCIRWDFHEVKDEWLNNVDFIYSNSYDHAYDLKKALKAWMSCLKPNGLLFLQWTEALQKEQTDNIEKIINPHQIPLMPFIEELQNYGELKELQTIAIPHREEPNFLLKKARWLWLIVLKK